MRKEMRRRCLVVGAALGLAPGALGQEAVSFVPTLTEGQQFAYKIAMRLSVRQTTGDAPANEASTSSAATMRFTVGEITEAGSAQVVMTVQAVQLDNEIEGETTSYRWPDGADPLEDALAILGEILATETIELVIANTGEVTIVSTLERFVDAAQEIAGSKSHFLLGLFNPETLGASLTPLFAIDGARASERAIDDQWNRTQQAPIAPIGVMTLESSFTVTSIEDGEASYTGNTSFSIAIQGDDQDSGPAIEVLEQSGETNCSFDTDAGLMRSRTRTMTLRTRWTLGDLAMEQEQDSLLSFMLIDPE